MAAAIDPTPPDGHPRFRIEAYVTAGEIRRRRCDRVLTGSVKFDWIYQNRPNDSRYAIVSWWDITKHAWRYASFDLFKVQKEAGTDKIIMPPFRLVHDDLDAIIMATLMLYGEEAKQ